MADFNDISIEPTLVESNDPDMKEVDLNEPIEVNSISNAELIEEFINSDKDLTRGKAQQVNKGSRSSLSRTRTSSERSVSASTNRKKISSNIRREKMIIWVLMFSFLLFWTGFADVIQLLSEEDDDVFSATILKPWLIPCVIVEFIFTATGFSAMLLKMKFIQRKSIGLFYRLITAFNNLQYLLVLIGFPCGTYFLFMELSTKMRADLNAANISSTNSFKHWNTTQTQRQCCGYHSRHDYMTNISTVLDYDLDVEDEILKDVKEMRGDITWPVTCCNLTGVENLNEGSCTESSKRYWEQGCHDTEFFVVLDYIIWTLCLIFMTLMISVIIRLWIDKLERYLIIFRPQEAV